MFFATKNPAQLRSMEETDYYEIAQEMGLDAVKKENYVKFMLQRFPRSRHFTTRTYALEWADRFKRNVEYNAGDLESQKILKEINPPKYGNG